MVELIFAETNVPIEGSNCKKLIACESFPVPVINVSYVMLCSVLLHCAVAESAANIVKHPARNTVFNKGFIRFWFSHGKLDCQTLVNNSKQHWFIMFQGIYNKVSA